MKKQLIPFLMAGDPSLDATERFANALIDEGVRTIELGVPFSDPMADGPVIQRSAARALSQGVTLKSVFKLSERLVSRTPDLKIVIFSYLNPILQYGLEKYASDAVKCGVSASLTVDLTPEEAGKYLDVHRSAGLGTVFLASPTTTRERLSLIDQASSEFIYYVSRLGVTGERSDVSTSLASELKLVRSVASKPIAVGFGISTPEQARDVARLADHVVVGSRLISLIEQSESLEAGVLQLRSFAKISFSMMTA